MPKFQRCDHSVADLAVSLFKQFSTHAPLVEREVKIDFVFAYADVDETTGEPVGNAITKVGVRCLGVARKLPLKDRAMGRGDAEICLDGDHWAQIDEPEQRALLDHELHHLVATEKNDDLGRPIIKLRKHTVEFGWFAEIAARHGHHSVERKQAIEIVTRFGQEFLPGFALVGMDSVELAVSRART